jgi:hypothetical protein
MSKRDLLALVGFLVLSFGAAGFGALFTTPAVKAGGMVLADPETLVDAAVVAVRAGLGGALSDDGGRGLVGVEASTRRRRDWPASPASGSPSC